VVVVFYWSIPCEWQVAMPLCLYKHSLRRDLSTRERKLFWFKIMRYMNKKKNNIYNKCCNILLKTRKCLFWFHGDFKSRCSLFTNLIVEICYSPSSFFFSAAKNSDNRIITEIKSVKHCKSNDLHSLRQPTSNDSIGLDSFASTAPYMHKKLI